MKEDIYGLLSQYNIQDIQETWEGIYFYSPLDGMETIEFESKLDSLSKKYNLEIHRKTAANENYETTLEYTIGYKLN